ncbi:hypothetical protein AIOL_002769 [Candidatus Rhodobacter oscarellae]|uniref:Uncharacterized protein n=1 Tax=Candidatus Rhodobacter oscarellae TaxID=1675527 RepID=A0A0J9E4Y1_9RHOB|nr:hypothetical protein [Candidatus Rhodobacter lobularis]KMW57801.1 hypothetical protein AIOL_002769 [Candidatus Rhodobacter lobularis]
MRKTLFAAVLGMAAVPAAILHAETLRETERFERKRVSAGEEVAREVPCPRGYNLTSGGYALYNLPDDRADFLVTASYPHEDGWRVEIRNVSDRPLPLTFRVYALCSN